ncbi:DUF7009 family protein [Flagellimonas beolgyonensis]|uniref:DUF7009 family protein n=1 Tax=Flagellimonas beolgyonensis TaxID=864064 RepID=UPI003D65A8B0
MKIRIKGNTVRFRLTQSEVRQLSETGTVTETTLFGPTTFSYQVALHPDIEQLQANYADNQLTLLVPESMGKTWFHDEAVGFENQMALPEGNTLHLLLEKDFTCLENRSEDESDNYPNPKLQC